MIRNIGKMSGKKFGKKNRRKLCFLLDDILPSFGLGQNNEKIKISIFVVGEALANVH
jgi:hypothetical protein